MEVCFIFQLWCHALIIMQPGDFSRTSKFLSSPVMQLITSSYPFRVSVHHSHCTVCIAGSVLTFRNVSLNNSHPVILRPDTSSAIPQCAFTRVSLVLDVGS